MWNLNTQTLSQETSLIRTFKGIGGEEEDIITTTEVIAMDMGQTTTIPTEEIEMNHLGEVEAIMTVTEKGNSRSGIMNSLQGQDLTEVIVDGRNLEGTKGKIIHIDLTTPITTKGNTQETKETDMKRPGVLQEINTTRTTTKEEEIEAPAPE